MGLVEPSEREHVVHDTFRLIRTVAALPLREFHPETENRGKSKQE